jgi:urease accessory protein
VTASAEIVAVAGDDAAACRLPVLRSQAPLVLRRTPEAVYLVGGAAGPIGGDSLSLTITVAAGALLRVRTAAASIALPSRTLPSRTLPSRTLPSRALRGRDAVESVLRVSVSVAAGGRLEYLPEPVVVSSGARHSTVVRASLEEGASLVVRDEVLLGRHGEAGGWYRSSLRVDYGGRPLLRHSLDVGGTDAVSLGPAVLARHRGVGALLVVGAGCDYAALGRVSEGVVVMPLAGPGALVTALAQDAVALRSRLTLLPKDGVAPDLGSGASGVWWPGLGGQGVEV